MKKPLELIQLNEGTIVIAGAHLTAEEAEKQFGEEYRRKFDRDDKITFVSHGWLRYETTGCLRSATEFDDCEIEPGTRLWFLYEQEKRPKGVTRAATAI